METLYPGALWRPLSDQQTEPGIQPTQLIWHTMVGYLSSTERMFRKDGYEGVESTFGLGGKYDGANDGVLYQWQRLTFQADAQASGNARANSIECSDGGHWQEPFTDKQIETSIRLGMWWCLQTGVPPVKAATWDAPGFGYHCMFTQWNPDAHSCPGPARASQLEKEIWPEIAAMVRTPTIPIRSAPQSHIPRFPLLPGQYFGPKNGGYSSVSGYFSHREDFKVWQRQMKARGWDVAIDGCYGDQDRKVCSQFQREKGLTVDGLIGPQTWAEAWTAKIT